MKRFRHIDALTIDDAILVLRHYGRKAKIIAGGTDLLGQMKNRIHPTYIEAVVNIKTVPDLDYIKEDADGLKIGALARLRDVEAHTSIREKYTALAQAAHAVASPQIRVMGTIGGNLCQDCRCWYYRAPKNYFHCLRKKGVKKGAICYALAGDNRYHSIFGAIKKCVAVNPSDTAPALIALNAKIRTTKRIIEASDLFTVRAERTTVLAPDEILTEIEIPKPQIGTKSQFIKFAFRKSIDFPVVNCAAAITNEEGFVKETRICLNAVHNLPYRAIKAEIFLKGKSITESIAEEAGKKAVEGAIPLSRNKYMIQIAKRLVERVIISTHKY
jgi:xanthine dehydrogenase YagS FAD-binding subunit